jgi:thiol-disulfide isomerase/thioredoxin
MKKSVLFTFLILIFASFILFTACDTNRGSNDQAVPETGSSGVDYLVKFQEARDSGRPMLVLYTAPNCPACVEIKPAIDEIEIEMEDKLEVIRFNIAEKKYSHLRSEESIRAVPTVRFVNSEGKVTRELLGNHSKQVLMEEIDRITAKSAE